MDVEIYREALLEKRAELLNPGGRPLPPGDRRSLNPMSNGACVLHESSDQRRKLVEGSLHRAVQSHARHWSLSRIWRSTNCQLSEVQVAVEHAARSDFVPVVIFRIDPEHRDRRDAVVFCNALGQLNRCQRLEQCEQRTAKESRLLACDNRDAFRITKARCGSDGVRGCVPAALLRLDDIDYRATVARMLMGPMHGIVPGGGMCRVAGKEIRDTLVLERVIGGQAFDPREATNLDGETAHCAREPCLREHRTLLSQSVARSVKATACIRVSH